MDPSIFLTDVEREGTDMKHGVRLRRIVNTVKSLVRNPNTD